MGMHAPHLDWNTFWIIAGIVFIARAAYALVKVAARRRNRKGN